MNGITCGTRLERLLALRDRIAYEIKVEQAAQATHAVPTTTLRKVGTVRAARQRSDRSTAERLTDMGVTALMVKSWAFEVGLVTEVARGRVAASLIDSYEMAHPVTA